MEEDLRLALGARRYRQAFERLLDLYERKVFRMAVMMLRDTGRAEEVTQDIFLKLWQVLPTYDERAAVSTWLYAIARNTCLSAVRAESYRRTTALDDAPEPAAPAASDPALAQCVSRLPPVQREVITLFYLEEKNVREVAGLLSTCRRARVKSHLHRARRALVR